MTQPDLELSVEQADAWEQLALKYGGTYCGSQQDVHTISFTRVLSQDEIEALTAESKELQTIEIENDHP